MTKVEKSNFIFWSSAATSWAALALHSGIRDLEIHRCTIKDDTLGFGL
jgi:hypothetical protein